MRDDVAVAPDPTKSGTGIAAAIVEECRSCLPEPVCATLGRLCSHPRALDVDVRDGEVTLRGPILAADVAGHRPCGGADT